MQIKVCGITDPDNMLEIAAFRPDYMGFIFFPGSPRDISDKIDKLGIENLPKSVYKVAVSVNESREKLISRIHRYGFEAVQLHGEESPDYCNQISDHCMVIKSFLVASHMPGYLADYTGSCDLFLFDAAGEGRGGNGEKFNHSLLLEYRGSTPFLLAGGIGEDDAEEMKALSAKMELFAGVDLNSRFETEPGIKDPVKLSNFIKRLYI